jgi:hypothetical protein
MAPKLRVIKSSSSKSSDSKKGRTIPDMDPGNEMIVHNSALNELQQYGTPSPEGESFTIQPTFTTKDYTMKVLKFMFIIGSLTLGIAAYTSAVRGHEGVRDNEFLNEVSEFMKENGTNMDNAVHILSSFRFDLSKLGINGLDGIYTLEDIHEALQQSPVLGHIYIHVLQFIETTKNTGILLKFSVEGMRTWLTNVGKLLNYIATGSGLEDDLNSISISLMVFIPLFIMYFVFSNMYKTYRFFIPARSNDQATIERQNKLIAMLLERIKGSHGNLEIQDGSMKGGKSITIELNVDDIISKMMSEMGGKNKLAVELKAVFTKKSALYKKVKGIIMSKNIVKIPKAVLKTRKAHKKKHAATKTKREKSLKNLDVKNMTTVDYMKERKPIRIEHTPYIMSHHNVAAAAAAAGGERK